MQKHHKIREIFERFRKNNQIPKSELISHNEYTFVIAVLLSAQSTDKSVNKATYGLFKIADTPQKMLKLGLEKLIGCIKTIGLYNNKAKNIINLSKILIEQFDSKVPQTFDELNKLPGIGRKSASVIMNHLFDGSYIAVDTHVLRLSNRLNISESRNPKDVEKELLNVIPQEFHKNASNWMVLHGRYICTAKKPKCDTCFLNDLCQY
ncbi:MAG: endonuclease III [Holosporales bacterium]|jgi:endonuclease-3|nr:endonuclease III [Holosporales bacterium]